jgi:hypothetical protein
MTGLEICRNVLNSFRPFLNKGSINNEAISKWLVESLDKSIPFFSSPIFDMRFPELQRLSVNKNLFGGENKRIYEIKYLGNPPPGIVKKFGRANLIGQSIFYSTLNPLTAIKEIKPNVGDLITTSIWKQKEDDCFLKISPIFKITTLNGDVHNELSLKFKASYENSLKKLDKELAEQIDELLKFVADCFAKEVEYGNNYDYTLSAYYADKILNKFQDGTIDALVYPSVADKLDFSNIAIKPKILNTHFELYQVDEGIVTGLPNAPGGGFTIEGTGWSRTFEDNKISWR